MKILARLPKDRMAEGAIWALDAADAAGEMVLGPDRCRGKADSGVASVHGNPHRSPVRPYGDHPTGVSRVTHVIRFKPTDAGYRHYGPAFLGLDPIAGDALVAKQNGRTGLAIHGGPLLDDGGLRATNGCNRVPDAFAVALADLAEPELAAGRDVLYEVTE